MRAIQQRYYVPNNTALIVTGDIDAANARSRWRKTSSATGRAAPIRSRPTRFRRFRRCTKDTARHRRSSRSAPSSSCSSGTGPSATQGSGGDLRRRRLLGRAERRARAFSGGSSTAALFAVDRRELLHAEPGRPDHDPGRDVARTSCKQAIAALDDEMRKVVEPGYITDRGARGDEAEPHRRHDVRARARVGLRAPARASGGR